MRTTIAECNDGSAIAEQRQRTTEDGSGNRGVFQVMFVTGDVPLPAKHITARACKVFGFIPVTQSSYRLKTGPPIPFNNFANAVHATLWRVGR